MIRLTTFEVQDIVFEFQSIVLNIRFLACTLLDKGFRFHMGEIKKSLHLEVDSDNGDRRLDRWLKVNLGSIPQSRIEFLCRKGKLKVNNKKVKASCRVYEGDIISLYENLTKKTKKKVHVSSADLTGTEIEIIKNSIIFEDKYLLAINKPSGVASQGGTGQAIHIDRLMSYFSSEENGKPKLVHRLDIETSGVLVLAKTTNFATILANYFKEGSVKKLYWALVAGQPPKEVGTIDFPLIKLKSKFGNKNFEQIKCLTKSDDKLIKNARYALSKYYVVESLSKQISWLALSPITGRTHQLRVHLSEINCPVVGDKKYGKIVTENKGDGWETLLGEQIENKLHLHARSIMFKHPIDNKEILIQANLPDHMSRSWKILGLDLSLAPTNPFV